MSKRTASVTGLVLWVLLASTAVSEDWPTYQHDNRRSAKTAEQLAAEDLTPSWVHQFARPKTAWPPPRTIRPGATLREAPQSMQFASTYQSPAALAG